MVIASEAKQSPTWLQGFPKQRLGDCFVAEFILSLSKSSSQ